MTVWCRVFHNKDIFLRCSGSVYHSSLRLLTFIMAKAVPGESVVRISDSVLGFIMRYKGPRRAWITLLKKNVMQLKEVRLISFDVRWRGHMLPVFDAVEYSPFDKCCVFTLNAEFASLLFAKCEGAEGYDYENILRLNSSYGIRLYDFLRLHPMGKTCVSAVQLRSVLGLVDMEDDGRAVVSRYRSFSSLCAFALVPSVADINDETDMAVFYRVIRSSSCARECDIQIEFSTVLKEEGGRTKVNLPPIDEPTYQPTKAAISSKASLRVHQRNITQRLRLAILARDNYHCVKCGRGVEDGVKLHVDHIIPVSKGGLSVPENLQTLCEDCNLGKGDHYERELAMLTK